MVGAGGAPSYPNMIGGFTCTQPAIAQDIYRGEESRMSGGKLAVKALHTGMDTERV